MLEDEWFLVPPPPPHSSSTTATSSAAPPLIIMDDQLPQQHKHLIPHLHPHPTPPHNPLLHGSLEACNLQSDFVSSSSNCHHFDPSNRLSPASSSFIPNFSSLLQTSASFGNTNASLTDGFFSQPAHGAAAPPIIPNSATLLGDFLLPTTTTPPFLMSACQSALLPPGLTQSASPRSLATFNPLNHTVADITPRGSLGSDSYNCLNANLNCYFQTGMGNSLLTSHGLGGIYGSNSRIPGVNDMNVSVNPDPIPQGKETSLNARAPSRSKLVRPLDLSPVAASAPTLFHKRTAQRNLSTLVTPPPLSPSLRSPQGVASSSAGQSYVCPPEDTSPNTNTRSNDEGDWKHGACNSGHEEVGERDELDFKDDENESGDGSGVLYETDDAGVLEGTLQDVATGDVPATGSGAADKSKGKKGLPAKNLMAERRRRKKLNDRLYTLRSVVPKITKMDRASILGDAIEYLKELLQRINDLHNELEASSQERPTLQLPSSFQALTPASSSLPCRVKEECPSSMTTPESQPPKVEVRTREGRALNIHMFCARRPGLLLSTMRALDGLGLDVQQAVISCFNGFALDVFRAEQPQDGEVAPDEIKRALLLTASSHNAV